MQHHFSPVQSREAHSGGNTLLPKAFQDHLNTEKSGWLPAPKMPSPTTPAPHILGLATGGQSLDLHHGFNQ